MFFFHRANPSCLLPVNGSKTKDRNEIWCFSFGRNTASLVGRARRDTGNILSRNGVLLSSFLTRAFRLDPVARNRALIPHDTFFRSEATRKSRGNATKLPKPVSEVWQVPRYNELPFQLPTTHRLAATSLSSIVSRMFRARAKLRATG